MRINPENWARPRFEPETSRTLSENHIPRPTSRAEGLVTHRPLMSYSLSMILPCNHCLLYALSTHPSVKVDKDAVYAFSTLINLSVI